jgi:hypothetical protein
MFLSSFPSSIFFISSILSKFIYVLFLVYFFFLYFISSSFYREQRYVLFFLTAFKFLWHFIVVILFFHIVYSFVRV